MADEWREYRLGEITDWYSGGTPSKNRPEFWGGEIPWISAATMQDTRYHDSNLRITELGLENGSRLVPEETILLLVRGSILHQRVPIGITVRPVAFNQDVKAIRPKDDRVDAWFLLYWFLSKADHLLSIVDFTGIGAGKFDTKQLQDLVICVPPKQERDAIAGFFRALDDKIELNRRMNETLEAMARAIFKSWFIDFDPVRRNAARARNQPSPGASRHPLPEGEGHYRSGYDFSALLETARELRHRQTPAEDLFWELVRKRRFMGLKFRRQHQLGDYIADFYCHEHRLVFELDGGIHSIKRRKDRKRDAWMQAQGFIVIRFPNEQFLDDPQSVLFAIADSVLSSLSERGDEGEGVIEGPADSHPLHLGEGRGEGSVEELDRLFPARLVDSELGEIPEGWEVGCVVDEFYLTMGQSPPGSTYNEAGQGLPFFQGRADFGFRFPTRRVYCTAPTRLAKAGDTLISVRAPVGDINMASEDCAIGRGVAAARHRDGSRSYSYQFMRSLEEVFARFEAEGTVFGSIGKKDFHAVACVLPPRDLVAEFERRLSLIDSRIEVNEGESRHLAALRDTLLPKLISGELRVKDAERLVAHTSPNAPGVPA